MNKAFDNFVWEDFPSTETPVNDENLNKVNNGLDEVDNRVIIHETTKFNKAEAQTLLADVVLDEDTGILTIVRYNGSQKTYSSLLGKISVNFDFDRETQKIILYKADGTSEEIDLSAFITEYEFVDSETINMQTLPDGKVKAIVKEGSIQEKHLQPNYLADIKVEVAKAQASATAAATSEANSKASENATKESEDAAKESEENAASYASSASESAATATQKAAAAAESEENAAISKESAAESAEIATTKADIATEKANISTQGANTATEKAAEAGNYATEAESFARGGTGTRDGEDSDNAKFYSEKAKQAASNGGWMFFEINSTGHLEMIKQGVENVSFALNNGRMEVTFA